MFEVCVFHRLKGCFCELIENRKVPFSKIPGTFGTIPVKLESNLLRSELGEIWSPVGARVSIMPVL